MLVVFFFAFGLFVLRRCRHLFVRFADTLQWSETFFYEGEMKQDTIQRNKNLKLLYFKKKVKMRTGADTQSCSHFLPEKHHVFFCSDSWASFQFNGQKPSMFFFFFHSGGSTTVKVLRCLDPAGSNMSSSPSAWVPEVVQRVYIL